MRPGRTVLWGGRPYVDRQLGSVRDRRQAAFDRWLAGLSRDARAVAQVCDEIAYSVHRAAEVLERSGLGQLARAARAQAADEARLARLDEPAGFLQAAPARFAPPRRDVAESAARFLVAPLGPGGCKHPASAHRQVAGLSGWRVCADCGVSLSPAHARHAATGWVAFTNPDDRTY